MSKKAITKGLSLALVLSLGTYFYNPFQFKVLKADEKQQSQSDSIESSSVNALIRSDGAEIPIQENFIGISPTHRPGIQMTPEFITVHNTANSSNGADAEMHSQYLIGGRTHEAYISWHYTVDDEKVIQHVPLNEIAYHAGDSLGQGNRASIGIEICENTDGNYRQSEENAETLIAQLLIDLHLTPEQVVPHQHWSGKYCPHNILSQTNGSVGWDAFISNITKKYNALKAGNSLEQISDISSKSTNTTDDEFEVGTMFEQQDAIEMKVGQTDILAVYQDDTYPTYTITEDGDDVEITEKNPSVAQTLHQDSTLAYTQEVQVISSNYDIDNPLQEFQRLMRDENTMITADENFFNTTTRTFQSEGLSKIRCSNNGNNCIFAIFNHVQYAPTITTLSEADENGWSLTSPSMDLQSVMNGTSQKEMERLQRGSEISSDVLITLMNQGEKKSTAELQQENTPDVNQLQFTSNNVAIAEVTSEGMIVAKEQGTVKISVTINGITLDRMIRVV